MLKEISLGMAIGAWVFYAMFVKDLARALRPYVFQLYVLLSVAKTTDGRDAAACADALAPGSTAMTVVAHKEVRVGWRLSSVVRNLMIAYCVLFVVMLAHARDVVQRVVTPEPNVSSTPLSGPG